MLGLVSFFLGLFVSIYLKFETELGWSNGVLTLVWVVSAILIYLMLRFIPKVLELIGDILDGLF